MTGRAILVTSGKGGVGKTTTTANVGFALAMRGRRVVLIDANLGLRNLDLALGVEALIRYDLGDVIAGKCTVEQAMVKDQRADELYLIPAPEGALRTPVSPERMEEVCSGLKERFDYILIDSPNGLEDAFRAVAAPADRAILVATPDVSAICNADRVIELLSRSHVPRPDLVLNRIRYRMVKRGDMLSVEDVAELLGLPLLGLVPEHEDIVVAANRGTPSVCKPNSWPGRAFREVAACLEGEYIPFTEPRAGYLSSPRRSHADPDKPAKAASARRSTLKGRLGRGAASGVAAAGNKDLST